MCRAEILVNDNLLCTPLTGKCKQIAIGTTIKRIDTLVVVSNDAKISVLRSQRIHKLRTIFGHILVFVYHDVLKLSLIAMQDSRVTLKQCQTHLNLVIEGNIVSRCICKLIVCFTKRLHVQICVLWIIFEAIRIEMILLAHFNKAGNNTASSTDALVVQPSNRWQVR